MLPLWSHAGTCCSFFVASVLSQEGVESTGLAGTEEEEEAREGDAEAVEYEEEDEEEEEEEEAACAASALDPLARRPPISVVEAGRGEVTAGALGERTEEAEETGGVDVEEEEEEVVDPAVFDAVAAFVDLNHAGVLSFAAGVFVSTFSSVFSLLFDALSHAGMDESSFFAAAGGSECTVAIVVGGVDEKSGRGADGSEVECLGLEA